MECVVLWLRTLPDRTAQEDSHRLGNFADDVWKEMLLHERYEIQGDRYLAFMRSVVKRPLRKKERDKLEARVKTLHRQHPELEIQIEYLNATP